MMNSSELQLQEAEVEQDGYDSSSLKDMEATPKAGSAAQKALNPNRSKHSETEQRRRSKINERFQILRGLIPENESKRDKASFLLEVIEYIKLLQAKLQMYEGSCQDWTQERSKFPWSFLPSASERLPDHSPIVKPCSTIESAARISNVSNSKEHDSNSAVSELCGATAHPFVSATFGCSNSEAQTSLSPAGGPGSLHTQSVRRLHANDDNVTGHSNSQAMQGQQSSISSNKNDLNEHEVNGAGDSLSIPSAYGQRVLNTLTHTLELSGVDLSRASISVQFDVEKRVGTATTLNEYHHPQHNDQTAAGSCGENCNEGAKRQRTWS